MFKKISCILASLALLLNITAGCTMAQEKKIKVAASFYPIYFLTSQIGGDKISVKSLIPTGVEPHDWEPKVKDIAYINSCKLFIYNGAGMESWLDNVLKSVDSNDLQQVNTSKSIKLIKNEDKDEIKEHGTYDPHVWVSIKNAKIQALNIKNALIKADSKNKAYYDKNYKTLLSKLNGYDKKYADSLKSLRLRKIITAHAAFAYLCRDYGLNQESIEGVFAEGEPGPKRMAEISKLCKKEKIKYVFSEELLSPKIAQTIAKEAGAKNLVLNPVESSEGSKNYFSILDSNLKSLIKALK